MEVFFSPYWLGSYLHFYLSGHNLSERAVSNLRCNAWGVNDLASLNLLL